MALVENRLQLLEGQGLQNNEECNEALSKPIQSTEEIPENTALCDSMHPTVRVIPHTIETKPIIGSMNAKPCKEKRLPKRRNSLPELKEEKKLQSSSNFPINEQTKYSLPPIDSHKKRNNSAK